ncbi:VCBS domain-containing protein [Cloacibacillus evryensis]|uniref:VCBS domain-containing protein n=1 Tax=Cloacibacillus evryensis TaxID=508460 RepID=UPI000240E121|nr:VCBS domain-containing protein [Cloacibacillus evryensis]EHL64418.1 VcbS [Synergistes sp. 3_1_syn1]
MAKQIVTKAEGEAFLIEADGSKIKLRVGDLIDDGARIITETGASVRFEDEKGVPLEIGENTGTILFSDAGPELSGTLLAAAPQDAPAKETDAPTPDDAGAQNPLPSDSEGEDDSEAHSFVELPRIKYGSDINLQYARDVNVTDQIEGRASLNPRIKYSYNLSIDQEIQSYKDTRFPFDGGAKPFEPERPTAGDPPAPETDGTKAVTAEDTGITVDPLENFVTPAGVELTVTGAAAQHGTVEILPDGTLKYTPAPDWFGTDVVNCTSTDQSGRTYNSTVEVTVTPVIDTRDDDAGTVRENSAIDTDVTANDLFADHEGAKVVSVTDGKYGTVTINEDGTVKYTPAIDFLAAGETITDQYTYTVQTAAGNLESATVTVTITGDYHGMIITPSAGDSFVLETDAANLSVQDTMTVTHADLTSSVTAQVADVTCLSGTLGGITLEAVKGMLSLARSGTGVFGSSAEIIDGTGTGGKDNLTWKFDSGSETFDYLSKGEAVRLEYTITIIDSTGTAAKKTIAVIVTGTNDQPEISVDTANGDTDRPDAPLDENAANAAGMLTLADQDVKDEVTVSVEKVEIDGSASGAFSGELPKGLESSLKNMLKVDGGDILSDTETNKQFRWEFKGGDSAFDFLAEGETITLKYTVKADDHQNIAVTTTDPGNYDEKSTDEHEIIITITGTNDAPVITGTSSGAVTETDATHLTDNGTLTLTDADISDTVTTSVTGVSVAGDGNIAGHIPTDSKLLSMFTTKGNEISGSTDTGTIEWTFDSGDKTFDYLAVGETVELTYTITATDSKGATTTRDVLVTVTGANDTPEITVETGDTIEHGFNETDAALSTSGTLTLTDLDLTDKTGSTVVRVEASGSGAGLSGQPSYGDLMAMFVTKGNELDGTQTTGKIDWTFDSGSATFDYLADGEELVLKYTVRANDDNNITDPKTGEISASNEQVITITITGTNDKPTLTGASDVQYSVTEDVTTAPTTEADIITGRVTDADVSDKLSVTKVNGTEVKTANTDINGTYGKLVISPDGKYYYELDNSNGNTQALQKGQDVKDVFTVTVGDGKGGTVDQTITVNVTGTNDSPDIRTESGDSAEKGFTEGSSLQTTGTLTLTDADIADTVSAKVGGVVVGGTHTLTTLQEAGFLKDPSKLLEMLQIKSTDAPESSYSSLANVLSNTETGADGNVTWKFNAGSEKFAFLNEGETLTLTYTIKADDKQDVTMEADGNEISTDTTTVTITITGTNSEPVLKTDLVTLTEDNGKLDGTHPPVSKAGNIFTNDTDPDFNGKDHWNAASAKESTADSDTQVATGGSNITGKYGTLHLNSNGSYTYTLSNESEPIQSLGHNSSLQEKFTVTVKDGDFSKTEYLIITIKGTNDTPVISVPMGEIVDKTLSETDPTIGNTSVDASGKLTLTDVDTTDNVNVSIKGVNLSGDTTGLISTTDEILKMLKLQNASLNGSESTKDFTWTFDSGTEAFNYLKDGETLTLTYTVQAQDDSGKANNTSNEQKITINIIGTTNTGEPKDDAGVVAEHGKLEVSAHTDINATENNNLLFNDEGDGKIISFKIAGDTTGYKPGTDVEIKVNGETIGVINIAVNGNYTFTPQGHFSGDVPTITYTTDSADTNKNHADLNITVTPLADAPTWTTPKPSGNEDAKIDLGLKLPKITDDQDLNGTAAAGDHPERLGYITISGIPKGATIYYNDNNPLTAADGKIMVVIVNGAGNLDTGLHYTGLDINDTNVVRLTQAEFETLKIQQAENSGDNITIDLSVTSYETNDDGTLRTDVPGAASTTHVTVDVQAVTDAQPDLKILGKDTPDNLSKIDLEAAINGGNITLDSGGGTVHGGVTITEESGVPHITVAEDSGTLVLNSSFITAKLTTSDLDGSEHYSITITGLEEGTKVNGITAGADGTVTLVKDVVINSGTNLNNLLDGLKITPPENFSGTMAPAITITTWDTDIDSKGDIAPKTDSITLPTISVTPVVDGVDTIAVKQAVGDEDTYIALDIKPSSQDPNETFNVRISDIPRGATIKYGDAEYKCGNDGKLVHVDGTDNPAGIELEDGKIIINDFDTSKLSILPPKDSNADFVLKVEAQSVERDGIQVSDWADSPTLNLAVTVHSVADPVYVLNTALKPLTYTETQAEANGIKLGKLIVKTDDNADGSEQVTLTVTNLAPEFTLAGSAVEFKGGEGTKRTWLVTMDKGGSLENTDAYIKTPANFSGKIEFSAQATNTDSTQDGTPDSSTRTSAKTDVAITVTPTPEATVNLSGAANEDELQQLSFAIKHQNGDTDETLNAIYIKASEVDAGHGKNFSVLYSEDDGKTTMTLQEALDAGKITKDGGFYKITSADGKDVDTIFVKGNAEYSGTGNALTVKYAVTDEAYTGEGTHTTSTPVTTVSGDTNYGITFKPVTDPTTMKAVDTGDITVDGSAITLSGTTVTVGAGSANSFSVNVTVNAPADVDGSEHFIKLIVDGVPDGVSVNGATYLGDSRADVGTGRWLLTVDAGKFFDSSHGSFTTKLDFTVDRGNPNIWGLHGEDAVKVTVTAVSQDEKGSMKGDEEESSTGAEFGIKIDFDGTDPAHADIPAPGINITKGAGTEEDSGECTLGNFIKAEYQIDTDKSQGQTEYRFSFEINGLPEDTVVSGDAVGGSVTIKEGGGVTVSGFGNQAAMQSVLDNIKVTLPPNYNNNSDSNTADGMNLDVTWKTDGWDLNGGDAPAPATGTINVTPNVTPITDPMEIKIEPASGTINENQPGEAGTFSFTVSVGAGNDGGYGNVLNEGKLFLKLDGAGESGAITYGDKTYPLTDVADGEYSGITAGKYYVIDGVSTGNELTLAYRPADYYSGNIKVTATIVSQETGAANVIAASGNSELTVNPVNSAYDFTVATTAANENGTANLTISQTGSYDNDGSEKIHSVVLSGVDAAHSDDFIVKYTVDGAEKTAAKVAAGTDAEGNQLYEWVLSTDSAGNLPIGIKITGLNHYSGTQNLTMTVVTGETALGTGKENSYGFSLTFHPTADGFSDFTPTLTFGKAGEYIDLNLNAMVNDTSDTGSETATVTLKGLGDGASFFIEDGGKYNSVTTAYDAANKTYTLSGIALDEINDIKILSPNVGKTNVTVDAWTVEPDAQSGYGQSKPISEDTGHFGNKFDITVSASAPTSGEDRLIYGGAAGTYDGGAGTDTLYLANFRETANSAKNDIDFEAAATIKNIEIIDMSDGAHSLTKVTAEAVKNMTDANNKLLIKGGDDDTIALSDGWVKGEDTLEGWRTYTNGGATINVDGGVNVMINGIASMSLMMAMAFAPLAAAAEPAIMPDSLAGYDFSSDFGAAAASGSPAFSLTAEGMIDFSSLTHSSFGTLDMENASAQSLYHVDPYGVYGVTDGSHELTVTGTELDSVSLADAPDAHWGAPELSADGSHYSYTATGDFDHDAATPDETVTLNVSRQIYDDTLAYDAHAMNDGGLGDDTLTFGHEDSTVDFSGGAASHIANIERFDLGEGDHSLENITAKDVFNMTDARGTLTINGDNADHVTLSDVLDDATDGMWESSPFQSVESGVSYSVYTGSFEGHMVTLKIEDEIIQQLTTHTKG